MNDQRMILLFVKYPEMGRVKTRLARTLGDEEAVRIYQSLVAHLLAMLRGLTFDELRIVFDPSERRSEVEAWIRPLWLQAGLGQKGLAAAREPNLVFCPQCRGDLGARLQAGFVGAFQESIETESMRVVAIGSDCIEIDGETFQGVWDALITKDVVIGPTYDGGYYLIGMNREHSELFNNIPWSSEKTLSASLQRVQELGLKSALLDEKNDIDTEEDWLRSEESKQC